MTSEPGRPHPSRRDAARTAAGGIALTAVVSLAGAFLAKQGLAAEGVQAVATEWGVGRLGVEWSPEGTASTAALRRVLSGAAIGLAAAAFVLLFARATGGITSIVPLLSAVSLTNALLHAGLAAVRDELLLHGLALRFLRGRRRRFSVGLLTCGAASAAWAFGSARGEDIALAALVVEALAGASCGALWLREEGAWGACGAHAAWVVALGARGAILARPSAGAWGGGGETLLDGWAAAVAFAPVCAALVWWAREAKQETSARPPAVR
jgi:hypothetical protein